jgi:hypothetical protein
MNSVVNEEHGKVVIEKRWTFEMRVYEDGVTIMSRINDGFSSIELLGIAENLRLDLREQIVGKMKPDIIKRTMIKQASNGKDEAR